MQCVMLLLVALVAAVQCKPQMVEWFQMTPAKYHKGATLEYKSYDEEFAAFKLKHNKSYTKELEGARYGIFEMNVRYIEKHNKLYATGKKTYYLGINQFTDMTREEFAMYNGLWRRRNRTGTEGCSSFLKPELFSVPEQVDWRKHGYVTPVKNQGQCGSCWSFSTTGSLEGQHFHKYKKLLSLSEQQLVDCSGKFGNEGCNGGLMDNAFEYIKAVGGLESESDYPYNATQDSCHFNVRKEVATCTGCVDVESGSEASLKDACGTVGPVSVAIDASHHSFQLYKGGVYNEPECSSTQLDHGVLVAGYGTDEESGSDYWLVKNSWGTTWGEEGFVKMSRNRDNQCGIASQASYPLV